MTLLFGGMEIGKKQLVLGCHELKPRLAELERQYAERSREQVRREEDYFFENYRYFWKNRNVIIHNAELCRTPVYFAVLSLAYIAGGPLRLGMLLQLWQRGLWTAACPKCGGTVRIFRWGGSPLSGNNSYSGRCVDCGEPAEGMLEENFASQWRPARELIEKAFRGKAANMAHGDQAPPPCEKNVRADDETLDFKTLSQRWDRDYYGKNETELRETAVAAQQRETEELEAEIAAVESKLSVPFASPLEEVLKRLKMRKAQRHALSGRSK